VVTHQAAGDRPPDVKGYVVGDFLAKGGQGAVYRARRLADGREVAFKIMLAKVAVDERSRKLFEREIEVTRSLRHPNIVELLDHGSGGVGFYFAMELCRGGSVDAVIQRRRAPFTLVEAGPLILQALDGLAFAHTQKYVHRDLKPPNLLLGTDERGPAKIADFGLAKSFEMAGLSGFSATGAAFGTLVFMPREQLTHYKYARPVTDVWSLAATLYFMLCGRSPREFGDRDPVQVILESSIVPISQRGVALPPRVADVLEQALAPKAEDRYQDAAAFRDALAAALG
jgi:eukaryotic-like serine/threonine-protein kinase